MENNKQTAVQWLVKNVIISAPLNWDTTIVKQALEMEKEQIKYAHLIGLITSMEMEATKQAEQYYNETFKSE